MARLITCGFESGSAWYEFDYYNGPGVEDTEKRTGEYSGPLFVNQTGYWWLDVTGAAELYLGFGLLFTDVFGSSGRDLVTYFVNGGAWSAVRLRAVPGGAPGSGEFWVYTGDTHVATSDPFPVASMGWIFVEFYWLEHSTTGRYVIKVNGITVLDFTGNTQQHDPASLPVDQLRFTGAANATILDDIVLNDASGGVNDSWPGIIHLNAIFPNGAGDVTQLSAYPTTPNWGCVDDRPPSGSDYVYETTPDTYDLYTLGDLSDPGGATIHNVVALTHAKLDTGSGSLAQMLKSGGVEDQLADVALTESWQRIAGVWPLDPDGDVAWTWAKINALQAGVKVR